MTTFTAAVWNVHHRRPDDVIARDIDRILAQGVDILGLNECGGHQRAVGKPRPGYASYIPDKATHQSSNTIIWKTSVFELVDKKTMVAHPSAYQGAAGAGPTVTSTEYITYARFIHRETGRKINFLVNHFPASIEGGGKPRLKLPVRQRLMKMQWEANKKLVRSLNGQSLVVGDFNWNAKYDWKGIPKVFPYTPRRQLRQVNLVSNYETMGLTPVATLKGRWIDWICFPDRPLIISPISQRTFDVNDDNDHKVLAVEFEVTPKRAPLGKRG